MACSSWNSLTLYETYTKLIIEKQLAGKTIDSKTFHNDKRLAEKGLSGKKYLKRSRNAKYGSRGTTEKINADQDTIAADDDLAISYKDFQKIKDGKPTGRNQAPSIYDSYVSVMDDKTGDDYQIR